jgi:ribosomal protein L7Ae-like RNA K-turn-binding protein
MSRFSSIDAAEQMVIGLGKTGKYTDKKIVELVVLAIGINPSTVSEILEELLAKGELDRDYNCTITWSTAAYLSVKRGVHK